MNPNLILSHMLLSNIQYATFLELHKNRVSQNAIQVSLRGHEISLVGLDQHGLREENRTE